MPVSGDIGLPGKRVDFRGNQLVLTPLTSDPANTQEGDFWLRIDLAPKTDQIATLRFDNGSTIDDIPIFKDGTSGPDVEEVFRPFDSVQGYIPILQSSPAFPQLGFQHAGARYGLHSMKIATPASGVSRWEFEQDFTDSWGTNDGANNGATFTTTAEVGTYAAAFDGASYVDFGAFGDGLDEFSVGAWIRPDALAGDMPILMRDGGGIRNDRHWALRIDDASGTIGMVAFDASNNQITAMSSGTVSTGSLVHVAGTVGGTTATVYISGSADGSDSNASYGAQPTSAETVKAGGDNVGGYDFYDGIIDDPRFYNKELTATEVSNLYTTGSIN